MSKLLSSNQPIILFVCAMVIILSLSTTSPSYNECAREYQENDSYTESTNAYQESAKRFVVCEGHFLDSNWEILTALATCFIAFFTLALWRSTDRLWKAGERQIGVAETAAKAARDNTDAVISMELPILAILLVKLDIKSGSFSIHFRNYGRTPAFIIADCMTCRISIAGLLAEPDYPITTISKAPVAKVVEKDGIHIVTRKFEISDAQRQEILKSETVLWVYGFVDYFDFLKTERRDGFCIKIKPLPNKRFPTMDSESVGYLQKGGPAYNYSKKKEDA